MFRSSLFALAIIHAVMLLGAPSAFAAAKTLGASSFESNGALFSGWHWVRAAGNTATWTFPAAGLTSAKPSSIYLNMAPLVTNGVNGGSGFGATVHLVVEGAKQQTMTMVLVNPFRPQDPSNSSGVGYQSYGRAVRLPPPLWKTAQSIKVTLTFEPQNKAHVAVNKDCLSIGYSE